MNEADKITANEIIALIHKKYEKDNSHIVLDEVPDGTGMNQHRWIDAAVFSLWPSKQLTRSAFEVKVSRSDFIRELQNPAKHLWVKESFHEFWFVAPIEVIQIDELPVGIGFMYPRGGKLCIKKHCVRNDKPKLDDVLLAAFMRAAWKAIDGNQKTEAQKVLDDSKEYQRCKTFSEAVIKFCNDRGIYNHGDETKEVIIANLEKATLDKKIEGEKKQILQVLDKFQYDIANLFALFAALANHSLLAKNEAEKYIISTYGEYSNPLDLKSKRKDDFQQRMNDLVNIILNWQNLKQGSTK